MTKVNLDKLMPDLKSVYSSDLSYGMKEGKTGGREVSLVKKNGKEYKFKFNELTSHIEHLAQSEMEKSHTGAQRKSTEKKLENALVKTVNLHTEGEVYKSVASKNKKFFTSIRQFFGNFGRSSHLKSLEKIKDKYIEAPKSEKVDALHKELRKALTKSETKQLDKILSSYAKGKGKTIRQIRQEDAIRTKVQERITAFEAKNGALTDKDYSALIHSLRKDRNLAFLLADLGGRKSNLEFQFSPIEQSHRNAWLFHNEDFKRLTLKMMQSGWAYSGPWPNDRLINHLHDKVGVDERPFFIQPPETRVL